MRPDKYTTYGSAVRINMSGVHRRFGSVPYITVTFNGNGGVTAGNEAVVVVKVKKGSLWSGVAKPEFFQSGTVKRQNGFTLVAGDDNTAIDPAFRLLDDISAYASFTVIEIGVITFNGEVYSGQQWADKFAHRNSPDLLLNLEFIAKEYASGFGNRNYKEGVDLNNLIEFIYFKTGEKAFAVRTMIYDQGAEMCVGGSFLPQVTGHYTNYKEFLPNDVRNMINAFDDIVFYPPFDADDPGKIPSIKATKVPIYASYDLTIILEEKYGNGELYTDLLEMKLASLGYTAEAITFAKAQNNPLVTGKKGYVASMYEGKIILDNVSVVYSIYASIANAMTGDIINDIYNYNNIAGNYNLAFVSPSNLFSSLAVIDNPVYGSGMNFPRPTGFYYAHCSNMYKYNDQSYDYWHLCRYNPSHSSTVGVVENYASQILNLFIFDVSDVFK